jgi:hypothetical protein
MAKKWCLGCDEWVESVMERIEIGREVEPAWSALLARRSKCAQTTTAPPPVICS